MKIMIYLILGSFLVFIACDKESTEPQPVLTSQLSITGDVTESYNVTALFGTSPSFFS